MADRFVHLHNHTEYSLLDGANRIPELVKRAKGLGMDSLAITDHGVMFGVMEFYFECQKAGIKPILGMEAYVAPNGHLIKTGREENQTYHLLLLAKNLEGYQNLCRLHTIAALQGFYYKPRIDHELLHKYSKGLISTTTCLGSEVNQLLLKGDFEGAKNRAAMYKEIFDEGSYFVELQDHGLPEQHQIKEGLVKIARDLKLPIIATNDAHYLCKESSAAHDVLLCIGTGALLADEKRLKFTGDEFYIKTQEEMTSLFEDLPEAIEMTGHVADMCDVDLAKRRAPMPQPNLPEGKDSKEFLRELSERGLRERVENLDETAWDRLNFELEVVGKTGFEDYFLLVREFANFTRDSGIAFGVRGSAAGSLVSYCIGITDVDPLKYDLTFERFLNPERISMPDIDMDFEDTKREKVIDYVVDRFGSERVAQIITFGTLGAKAAIKDAGRVMGYAPMDTDRICKTIPQVVGMNLEKAYKEIVDFRNMVDQDPQIKKLVEVAKEIEGTSRHAGVHAAGVVIAGEPLSEYIPLYRSNEGSAVTGFEMGILEKIGMLKMDFLGLSNLTVLAKAAQNIEASRGIKIVPTELELDDEKTYEMLAKGETIGVFQLESAGMRRNIIELKPKSVQELAAMVALYRPGPMEHIPTYVDAKFGRKEIVSLHELMEPILRETYGVIVYQDQVLKLVQALAGFTLGKADILRRAMGKKDAKAMDEMQVEFLAGAEERGVSVDAGKKVWELLMPFAGYAFNKAHAVCYALLAYQTGYLKANYPVEYMAALLAVYYDKEERVTAFIEECRRQRIPVLPPDINRSVGDFGIEKADIGKGTEKAMAIRFGMAAIKGVGSGLVDSIIVERAAKPFTHLYEFCERTKPLGLNRTALDAMIKSGALDSIDRNRKKLLSYAEAALQYAETATRNRIAGQDSLFGETSAAPEETSFPHLPETEVLTRQDILTYEKEVMGIYISDHPLRGLENLLRSTASHISTNVPELDEGLTIVLAGIITGLSIRTTKAGEKMASFMVEDFSGQSSCIVFAKTYNRLKDIIEKDKVVKLKGTIMFRDRPGSGGERQVEVRVEDVNLLEGKPDIAMMSEGDQERGLMTIRLRRGKREQLEALREVIKNNPGDFRAVVQIGDPNEYLPIELTTRVEGSDAVARQIEKVCSGTRVEMELNRYSVTSASVTIESDD
ncbi:MAG: DNA polymerase III subunit alpha [Armatimonadetes bacterium]|nr:DNA polymerase III subunit alpha [Armatimonadota bacterium]